jgi:predicted phage terminase large subunit-like protein
VEKIPDLYEKWKPSITGLERGVIEMSIGPFLEKRISERRLWEMYIEELKPGRRDKVARARAIQGRLQQGKVFFPADGPFTHTLIAEMLRFPSGEHDDQVDALAWVGHMLSVFHGLREPRAEEKKSWKDKLRTVTRRDKNSKGKKDAMAA